MVQNSREEFMGSKIFKFNLLKDGYKVQSKPEVPEIPLG